MQFETFYRVSSFYRDTVMLIPFDHYRRSFDPTLSMSQETRDFRDTQRANNLHSKRNDQTCVTSEKPLPCHSRGNGWSLRMQTISKTIQVIRAIDAREGQRHKKDRLLTLTSISFSRQANWVRLERLPPGLPATLVTLVTLPLILPIGTVPLLPPVEDGWGSGGPLAGSNPWLRWSLPPCLTGWPG